MKVCLFAETQNTDINCYQNIVSRLLNECFFLEDIEYLPTSFDPGSKGKLIKLLPIELDILATKHDLIDFVIIFVDCDNSTPNEQKKELEEKVIAKLKYLPASTCVLGLPKRNIEAWLLSDINNINKFTKTPLNEFKPAELITDPQGEMKKIWRENSNAILYSKFLVKLSEGINIELLLHNSKTFKKLHDDLKAKLSKDYSIHHVERKP